MRSRLANSLPPALLLLFALLLELLLRQPPFLLNDILPLLLDAPKQVLVFDLELGAIFLLLHGFLHDFLLFLEELELAEFFDLLLDVFVALDLQGQLSLKLLFIILLAVPRLVNQTFHILLILLIRLIHAHPVPKQLELILEMKLLFLLLGVFHT